MQLKRDARKAAHDNIGRLREVNDGLALERAKLAVKFAVSILQPVRRTF
jgi:hypothetical protein